MRLRLFAILSLIIALAACSDVVAQESLPTNIHSGPFKAGHVQGIAIDRQNNHIYLSYTTMLIKTDLQGNILGSIEGLVGHLGDLTFNSEDGKVYGSLEYKDDSIGKGILKQEGVDRKIPNSFYIAIIDGAKINRQGIAAEDSGIVETVHLKQVLDDYSASVKLHNGTFKHRLGCSGIDGVSIGPKFGKRAGKMMLTVAYGIYNDTNREDNNYQVLHQYDISNWHKYAQPLSQVAESVHSSGPDSPDAIYYAYTGNTNYGVQNLEYDPELKVWWMAVYRGSKKEFPNYSLFAADGTAKPKKQSLAGIPYIAKGLVVPLQQHIPCLKDSASGVSGWHFGYGSTGFYPAGNGYYYISHNYANKKGQGNNLRLYRFTGEADKPFTLVEE